MVVMRSPKQSQSRSRSQSQSQRGSSLQPSAGASTGLTPGKGDGGGLAGNKLLEQRIAESLQLVAASPSLKANAPWPFASSTKLRRSPPRSKLRPPAPSLRFETSVDAFDASNAILNEAEPALAAAAGTSVTRRNFEVAARALFDGKKGRPAKGECNHREQRSALIALPRRSALDACWSRLSRCILQHWSPQTSESKVFTR